MDLPAEVSLSIIVPVYNEEECLPAFAAAMNEFLPLSPMPVQVLFVDDMEVNVEAARAVGLRAEHWHLDRGHDALNDLLSRHGVRPAA